MEEALGELRRSRPKTPVGGDFTLSDCFYFYRRGIEDIVEDEVRSQLE
jgi:glycerol-3-phosphate O-acyltransferase 3/4